jgi:hypothetical protein
MTLDECMGGWEWNGWSGPHIPVFHYLVASIHFFGVSLIGTVQEDYIKFALHCQMKEESNGIEDSCSIA